MINEIAVPKDIQNSKSGNKTSLGRIGLSIGTHVSSKKGKDHVSFACIPQPLQMLYGNI